MTFRYDFITRADQIAAAERLGVSVAVIKAVSAVEARRTGFIRGTDLPQILFEGHVFHRLTGGVHSRAAPSISYPRWTRAHYKGGRGEYARLAKAIELSAGAPDHALQSASWGMFQIMGFNHRAAGYASVTEFVDWMATGENHHLAAFVGFIEANGLADELRGQDWAAFARAYNGPGFAKNAYHTKLAAAFRRNAIELQHSADGRAMALERGDVAALQVALNLKNDAGLAADGWPGPKTAAAIRAFRARHGLAGGDTIDMALCEALEIDLDHYLKGNAA